MTHKILIEYSCPRWKYLLQERARDNTHSLEYIITFKVIKLLTRMLRDNCWDMKSDEAIQDEFCKNTKPISRPRSKNQLMQDCEASPGVTSAAQISTAGRQKNYCVFRKGFYCERPASIVAYIAHFTPQNVQLSIPQEMNSLLNSTLFAINCLIVFSASR